MGVHLNPEKTRQRRAGETIANPKVGTPRLAGHRPALTAATPHVLACGAVFRGRAGYTTHVAQPYRKDTFEPLFLLTFGRIFRIGRRPKIRIRLRRIWGMHNLRTNSARTSPSLTKPPAGSSDYAFVEHRGLLRIPCRSYRDQFLDQATIGTRPILTSVFGAWLSEAKPRLRHSSLLGYFDKLLIYCQLRSNIPYLSALTHNANQNCTLSTTTTWTHHLFIPSLLFTWRSHGSTASMHSLHD
jgi:hypothetical protein